jgi:hypothetical protein
MAIKLATGPQVSKVSKEEAEAAFRRNPDFPKHADEYVLEELDGHWVAAVHVADSPFGGPADETEEAPGPKSEGPGDTAPEEGGADDGETGGDEPPKDDENKEDGKEKGGEKHEIHALMDAVQKILVALGIPDGEAPGENAIPGEEPPAGPPGPPQGGPPAPDEKEKGLGGPLKPGEVPPGQTPVGAPAFAHITPHPWDGLIGVAATFEVEERVPDHYTAADVDSELNELARGTGFKVKQVQTHVNEHGHKVAKALISAY